MKNRPFLFTFVVILFMWLLFSCCAGTPQINLENAKTRALCNFPEDQGCIPCVAHVSSSTGAVRIYHADASQPCDEDKIWYQRSVK